MKAPKFETLAPEYDSLWASMEIRDIWEAPVRRSAAQIVANRARYEAVETKTGVPWWFVGVIHQMEGGLNFGTHLHNGDSLKARTKQVPAGRPKAGKAPFTWEESAIDALTMKGLNKISEWTLARCAYELERYNGFGYRVKGRPNSPYLWSGTNHYVKGKFIADGRYSASAVSKQSGALALLRVMSEAEADIASSLIPQATAIPTEDAEMTRPAPAPAPNVTLPQASRKFWLIRLLRWIVGGTGASVGVAELSAENIQSVASYWTAIKGFVSDNGMLTGILVIVCAYAVLQLLQQWMAEDYSEGRYTPSGEA